MSISVYEYRSEEEHVGNLMLISSEKNMVEIKEILKALWIEAENYSSGTPNSKKEKDFEDFYQSISLVKISKAESEYKISSVVNRLSKFEPKTNVRLDVALVRNINFEESYLIEESFSSLLMLFIGQRECYMFSWVDVI
ncbi:hypothetical protein OE749_12440 [Aestuariibacter sp. AA17]|uniref:IraD/Gp25-like domain-containing protein n=1 Tax=Fluctibacter corallii TaxID=2984329 RepID=A0ABT3AA72_9ALTE|nr:hypothetical protein [Aestuariibacter sp. AA17]MCV2885504.1 hypothetical protein [Aestuariibacter sp. AA17]